MSNRLENCLLNIERAIDQNYVGNNNNYKGQDRLEYHLLKIQELLANKPVLKAPKSIISDSRNMSVSIENQDAPFVLKNRIYCDGVYVGTVEDSESADFSAHVKNKHQANIEVSAVAAGFKESAKLMTVWKLTNGSDNPSLKYSSYSTDGSTSHDVYMLTSIPTSQHPGEIIEPLQIASYIDGKPVKAVQNVSTINNWYKPNPNEITSFAITSHYRSISFLNGVDHISDSFNGSLGDSKSRVECFYIPYVRAVQGSFDMVIDRLYCYENLPSEIIGAVKELSGSTANGFKRINTWCTGVGTEAEHEFGYKEDNTVRLCYSADSYLSNNDLIIPDILDGKPVNGIGKFYSYNNLYVLNLVFGDNMENINDSAFRNCTKLRNVKFGKGLKTVSEHAFRYCPIVELDFSDTILEEIKGRAFGNNTALKKITLPATVKAIASTAFAGDTNVTDIYVPWDEGAIANAPWGATKANIHYNS